MARLPPPVTITMWLMPEAMASSTPYWIEGLSTSGSISLGWALVIGRKRVPRPAAGKTAFITPPGLRPGGDPGLRTSGWVTSDNLRVGSWDRRPDGAGHRRLAAHAPRGRQGRLRDPGHDPAHGEHRARLGGAADRRRQDHGRL